MVLFDSFLREVQESKPQFPLEPLKKAYQVAMDSHGVQTRKSGEPYIIHPIEVDRILLQMNLDLPSLVAGLLHDTVEDTHLTRKEIEKEFGKDVGFLVEGVTKLSKLSFKSKHTAQAENFRKMMLAMGQDVRVILIKLADRLHNMRSLQFMPAEKQIEIASETLEIYAPLAHRLGINWIKTELQDLSLRFLKPEIYYKLVELVAQSRQAREKYIQEFIRLLDAKMKENGIEGVEIKGRPKNFYSIYKKMESSQLTFEQIHDLLAFRLVCQDIKTCYQILGMVHSLWKPVPGRFKDYIAMPKANLYQSLHTTVIGPEGQRLEIQIRTQEMHDIAEYGIAAHWTYKDDGSVNTKDVDKFSWVRKLVEDHEGLRDPSEFLSTLKMDLFEEEVFVFSPKGDVIALPNGSCPIDFAYAIHSEVGNRCVGARINGRLVPLREKLKSGDEVEIITSDAQTPRKDWLDFVVTSRARSKIRALVKKAQREESKEIGLKLLEREFKKLKLNYARLSKEGKIEELARQMGAAGEEDLLIKVGYGKILALDSARQLAKDLGLEKSKPEPVSKPEKSSTDKSAKSVEARDKVPVKVEGIDNMLIRFAKCCHPIPGEPIVGFVSRGRGISVHAAECQTALNFDPERKVDLEWDAGAESQFKVGVRVKTVDRPGMLAEITQVISNKGANITNAKVTMHDDQKATILFEVYLKDLPQLRNLLIKLEGVDGVIAAERYRV